jgi:hypothetical protein
LNWIAGEEKSFFMSPPHFGQISTGGSEKRWMISWRSLHCLHWYS